MLAVLAVLAMLAVLAVLMCLFVHISRIILFVYVCVQFHQISTLSKRVMFFALCWLFVAGFITHQLYIYIYNCRYYLEATLLIVTHTLG